jgi:hypothetical protein
MKTIRKDLKNYVFEYLNERDLIHIYFCNTKFREVIKINKNYLFILKYLLKLKMINSKQIYLNLYNDECLVNLIFNKFSNKFIYEDIINSIVSYIIIIEEKHFLNKLLLKIEKSLDVIKWKDITTKLKSLKFEYFISNNLFNTTEEDLKPYCVDIIKNMKYINLSNLKITNFFPKLIEHDIFVEIEAINNCLLEESTNYFSLYNNTLNSLHINFLESKIINLSKIINFNCNSLRTVFLNRNNMSINDVDSILNELKKCENLAEVHLDKYISDNIPDKYCSTNNSFIRALINSKNISSFFTSDFNILKSFASKYNLNNLKIVGDLNIESKNIDVFVKVINSFYNLENLSIKLNFNSPKMISHLFKNIHLMNLKKLKITLIIFYEDLEVIISNLIKFKNLSCFYLIYENFNISNKFEILNVIHLPNLLNFTQQIFNFILSLIKNNKEVKRYNIFSKDNEILSKLINSIFVAKELNILNNIFNVSLAQSHNNTKGERNITKKLSDINSLSIPTSIDFKSFTQVKKINEITLNTIYPGCHDFLDFISKVNIKSITINIDPHMCVLNYISSNHKQFKNLKYLKISETQYSIMKFTKIIDNLKNLRRDNLIFKINVNKNYNLIHLSTLEELINIIENK